MPLDAMKKVVAISTTLFFGKSVRHRRPTCH
jgi:hypothetical protein